MMETERKYKPYADYKESGIEWLGEIPNHWGENKLKYISSVQTSNVDKKTIDGEQEIQLCNYTDVYHNNEISPDIEFMTATATNDQIEKFRLTAEDVIITKDSESWNDIAVPSYVPHDFDNVICGYHLAQIKPDKTKLCGKYLYYSFLTSGINEQFQVSANGITRYGLGKYSIDNSVFYVPSLEEQQTIASFLDRETARIDELIAKKEQLIALLEEKRTALISHAVTKGLNPDAKMKDSGIEWLGEIPEHWEHHKLGYMGDMIGGATPSMNNREYWSGNIPWVSPKEMKRPIIGDTDEHISDSALLETSLNLVPKGSVLIVVRGMILVHSFPVAIAAVPLTINQDMKAISLKSGFISEYVTYLLNGIKRQILLLIEDSAHGTKCLRTDIWKGFEIFIPNAQEQKIIVRYINTETTKIDNLIDKVVQTFAKLQEYRTALISAAVTGKIDVREQI